MNKEKTIKELLDIATDALTEIASRNLTEDEHSDWGTFLEVEDMSYQDYDTSEFGYEDDEEEEEEAEDE